LYAEICFRSSGRKGKDAASTIFFFVKMLATTQVDWLKLKLKINDTIDLRD